MKNVRNFVVQRHTKGGRPVHWDLMLEMRGVLQTYRMALPPQELLRQKTVAVKIFDHPLKFLTYEGSLSKAKGSVQIADRGTYIPLDEAELVRQVQFNGEILKGKFVLRHIGDDKWEFYFLNAGRSGST
ncbi:MAG: DNA polymerase ligase N-terminal domain-containing protein [Planctomycetota bacterium]|jgi:bifunctional non-homologous end joining protein LigD